IVNQGRTVTVCHFHVGALPDEVNPRFSIISKPVVVDTHHAQIILRSRKTAGPATRAFRNPSQIEAWVAASHILRPTTHSSGLGSPTRGYLVIEHRDHALVAEYNVATGYC